MVAEAPMSAEVPLLVHRCPQIVWTSGILGFSRLLRVVAVACEIPIAKSGSDTIADDRFHGWKPDEVFAARMIGGPQNGVSRDFRREPAELRAHTRTDASQFLADARAQNLLGAKRRSL